MGKSGRRGRNRKKREQRRLLHRRASWEDEHSKHSTPGGRRSSAESTPAGDEPRGDVGVGGIGGGHPDPDDPAEYSGSHHHQHVDGDGGAKATAASIAPPDERRRPPAGEPSPASAPPYAASAAAPDSSSDDSDPSPPPPPPERSAIASPAASEERRRQRHDDGPTTSPNGRRAASYESTATKWGGPSNRRRRVEFVYPSAEASVGCGGRGGTSSGKTFVAFSFRQSTVTVASASFTTLSSSAGREEEGGGGASSSGGAEVGRRSSSGETIDDILFPQRAKKKKEQQQEEEQEQEQERQRHKQRQQHEEENDGGRDVEAEAESEAHAEEEEDERKGSKGRPAAQDTKKPKGGDGDGGPENIDDSREGGDNAASASAPTGDGEADDDGARRKKGGVKRKDTRKPMGGDGDGGFQKINDSPRGECDTASTSAPTPATPVAPAPAYGLSVEDAVRDRSGCRPRSNSTDGELNLPRRGLCDERFVLASHRWNVVDVDGDDRDGGGTTSSPAAPAANRWWTLTGPSADNSPRGLVNLGNTCFLNATLQCLAYLPTFCQCVTNSDGPAVAVTAAAAGCGGGGGRVSFSVLVRSLLRRVHHLGETKKVGGVKTGPIAPRGIAKALPTLGERRGRFRLGRQEDAHEFLVHLLDAMKDGELRDAGIDQRKSGWRDRLPIPRLDETTMIHRTFGGYFRSQVRCTICGYRSNTYDPFLDLELEVSKGINSVTSAIADFTRKETLDEANRWKCNGCKKHVCATKHLTVFRPPLSLCITLKRFSFGGFGGWQNRPKKFGAFGPMGGGGSKIRKAIEFPAHLSLPLSDKRKCEYVLTGVIIHIGADASSGHYTAYVKKPLAGGRHQWYHMDDSRVSAVSERTVLRESDAYVLFYCRKEVKLEFPSPPARSNMSASEATKVGKARARARADSIASNASSNAGSIAPDEARLVRKDIPRDVAKVSVGKQYVPPPHSEIAPGSAVKNDAHVTEMSPVKVSSASRDGELGSNRKSEAAATDRTVLSAASCDSQCDDEESRHSASAVRPTLDLGMAAGVVLNETHDSAKKAKKKRNDRTTSPSSARKKSVGKVVLDRGPQHGTVEVITGRARKGTPWKAGETGGSSDSPWRGVDVGTWDDGDDHATEAASSKHVVADGSSCGTLQPKDIAARKAALNEMQASERSRKRSMHLDRWDAALDEGKKKKVKTKERDAALQRNVTPEDNPFHRTQSKMQQLGKGQAKGTATAAYRESLSWAAPSLHSSSPSWLRKQNATGKHQKKMHRMKSKGARRYGKGHRGNMGGRGRGR